MSKQITDLPYELLKLSYGSDQGLIIISQAVTVLSTYNEINQYIYCKFYPWE